MMEALNEAPPASVESLATEESIVKALRQLLPTMNADTATVKVVMQKLALHFGMEFNDLKTQWRPHIKTVLPELVGEYLGGDASEGESEKNKTEAEEEGEEEEVDLRPSRKRTFSKRNAVVDASDEEEDINADENDSSEDEAENPEEEDEDDFQVKRRRKTQSNSYSKKKSSKSDGPTAKKTKTIKEHDSPGLSSLKELGRAAGVMNPRLYKLLKSAESGEEAEDIMRDRLQDAGVAFSGSYPSSRDISAAKRKHDKAKELEGIDTGLIITGGRSRRGESQPISYKEDRISGEEDDEDDDEDADEFGGSDSDSSQASL